MSSSTFWMEHEVCVRVLRSKSGEIVLRFDPDCGIFEKG